VNVASLTALVVDASVDDSFGQTTVDVPRASWQEAVHLARTELGCDWFDFLTAVDDPDGPMVVCHVARTEPFGSVLLRARLAPVEPTLASVGETYAGAAWHERETAEMFGITFLGASGSPLVLDPLLLPPGFEGHPLRKEFALQARLDRPWPGAKEPT
jgi:NADH-quinone oxidoreductase subunit C